MTEYKAKFKDLFRNFEKGKQTISFTIEGDAQTLFEELKDKYLTLTIKEFKEKRSLDANAYLWLLIGKLTDKLNREAQIENTELYRLYIKQYGIYRDVEISEEAVGTLQHAWGLNGIGWLSEVLDYANNNYKSVRLYYGSSSYTTKQMSRLINAVVQDCKEQGIETKSDEEVQSLLRRWKND